MLKHNASDKFDGYLPNKTEFVHDNYCISDKQEHFHTPITYHSKKNNSRGFFSGVQKRAFKVSGRGIQIDSFGSYTGKSS